ncbi:serine protease inhibitor 42Dd isoform X2 [Lucilia cuprina]|uniref:serine protease inhibitor 42Dd isoform X2 n=1 Tax=Lucilia cuprina TaxID=7375 RepID=UPI001F05CE61|nr:serine protease inhibitor 42Dd isoform X2 [Lucilia cuprina]
MFDFNLEFARGGAKFTVELFKKLSAGGVKENIVFSPFSIQTCLALAFAGAEGETADEIANAMRFVSNFPPEVAETFQFVLEKYKDSDLLKIANKVYVQEGKSLKADYATATKEQYHAEAEEINFGECEAAAEAINSWVEDKTNGKITNLVTPGNFNALTRLVLLNALHFKGDWEKKFDESHTQEDDFWIAEEQSVKVNYMNQKAKFGYGYFEELNCQALEMPYKDSDLSMFVLLPNEREGLKDLAEKLQDINLVDLADKMNTEEVVVKFPKFKVDYSVELCNVLKEMGIKKAFGKGEFNNMLEEPVELNITNIMHKAIIEVNEVGTEAAAATKLTIQKRCMPRYKCIKADHPFFYMIWNKKNILFAGVFVKST